MRFRSEAEEKFWKEVYLACTTSGKLFPGITASSALRELREIRGEDIYDPIPEEADDGSTDDA